MGAYGACGGCGSYGRWGHPCCCNTPREQWTPEMTKRHAEAERKRNNAEFYAREELQNICENYPLFAGKTISHSSANDCVRRGWAERNQRGDFLPTSRGLRANDLPMPTFMRQVQP